jgi:hypothetical protein
MGKERKSKKEYSGLGRELATSLRKKNSIIRILEIILAALVLGYILITNL